MPHLRSLPRRPALIGRGLLALLLCLIAAQAAAVQTTTVTYYHTDLIGSVVATSDEAGLVSWRSAYLPYGEQPIPPPNPDDRQGFAGKSLGAGGVIDFGARAYDPGIGRFQGLDPQPADAGDPHSFNRYAYAHNNPYRYTDPDGEFPILAVAMLAVDLALNYQATGSVKGALIETGKGLINPLKKIKLAGKIGSAVKKVLGSSWGKKRGSNFTYRGDSRSSDEIFANGFKPRGSSTDLHAHALDNTRPPSAYISTSKSADVAADFSDNVYVVRPRNGIDVNKVLGSRSPFPDELEVAVPGRIAPSDIRAVTRGNVSTLNPRYKP